MIGFFLVFTAVSGIPSSVESCAGTYTHMESSLRNLDGFTAVHIEMHTFCFLTAMELAPISNCSILFGIINIWTYRKIYTWKKVTAIYNIKKRSLCSIPYYLNKPANTFRRWILGIYYKSCVRPQTWQQPVKRTEQAYMNECNGCKNIAFFIL